MILLMIFAGRTRFHPNARKFSASLEPRSWATFEENYGERSFQLGHSNVKEYAANLEKNWLRQCDGNYVYAGTNVPTMSFFAADHRSSLRPCER